MVAFNRARKWLGISVGERSATLAEVSALGAANPIARTAQFIYPDGITLEQPQELGTALRQFLDQRGFSRSRAVVGVPARWLSIRALTVPPADPETAAGILWMQAAERTTPELGPMVFDFEGSVSAQKETQVLLAGLQQRWIDRLRSLADAAGLRMAAITPVGFELAAATRGHADHSLILSIAAEGMELAAQDGRRPGFLRYIGQQASPAALLAELRRAAAASPVEFELPGSVAPIGSVSPRAPARTLVIWDEIGLEASFIEQLRSSCGMPVTLAQPDWVDLPRTNRADAAHPATIALTLSTRRGEKPAVDFLHPRLVAPRQPSISRRTAWLSAAAAVILLAGAAAIIDTGRLRGEINRNASQLADLQTQLGTAKPFVANMRFMETYQQSSPRYLSCLCDLASAVPPDGQITFNSFALHMPEESKTRAGQGDKLPGQLSGVANDEQSILTMRDRLTATGRFPELDCKWNAHQGGAGAPGRFTFTLTFVHQPQS